MRHRNLFGLKNQASTKGLDGLIHSLSKEVVELMTGPDLLDGICGGRHQLGGDILLLMIFLIFQGNL